MSGGWVVHTKVDNDCKKVFEEAFPKGFVGATHEPLIVATQVVSGVNYKFICKKTLVTNAPVEGITEISFYKNAQGQISHPVIKDIL